MVSPADSNEIIERRLDELLSNVATAFGSDALNWLGPIEYGTDNLIRNLVEGRVKDNPTKSLTVLLGTPGGIVEVVQRIVDTLRHHYDIVNFVIPDSALSAGTVLAMSGDAIFMDYYSRLGPIDPQIWRKERLVPALGYCKQYKDLLKEGASRPGGLTDAELTVLLDFDQAELYQFEQARELSIALLKEWLVRYKFKDWNETASRKLPVTSAMKKSRAKKIAKILNDTERWHSHGFGISAEVLRGELNMKIDELDGVPGAKDAVVNYQALLDDYMLRRGHLGVMHAIGNYLPYHVHGV